MKTWFTNEEEPPRRRVCTCQKCIRTPDIENIGKTDRHGTYFEMLASLNLEDEEAGHPVVGDFSIQAPSVLQTKWVGIGLFLGLLAGCFLAVVSWKPARKE